MADEPTPDHTAAQSSDQLSDRPDEVKADLKAEGVENGSNGSEEDSGVADQANINAKDEENVPASDADEGTSFPLQPQAQDTEAREAKPTTTSEDGNIDNEENAATASADAAGSAEGAADGSAKSKSRRKSGVPEHRGKKLNRKQSQAKMLHLDAKPGEYYLVKLKGYPTWPAIICDEDMLPQALLGSRPQTAARMDGSYREGYGDGEKRVRERTFPVMFMATNEFAWTPNTDLRDFNVEESRKIAPSRTRNLNLAHQLACEQHPLSHWKKVLHDFQESVEQAAADEKVRKLEKEEKERKRAAKKDAEEYDVADDDDDAALVGGEGEPKKKKSNKKRELAEGEGKAETPAKKIKLNVSSKSANATPASSAKPKKEPASKSKKASKAKDASQEPALKAPEPEMTPEELRVKKEREILFLRHKLQKGLLNRDAAPEEAKMGEMAEYIKKLEGYPDLEVSIIKTTKINKVLKAILKLEVIPKEEEYNFKGRSTQLLAKWNHILENAPKEAPASAPATNGVANGEIKAESSENPEAAAKEEAQKGVNEIKAESEPPKADEDVEMKEAPASVDAETPTEDAVKEEAAPEAVSPAPEGSKDTPVPDAPAIEASV